jgi:hypothetical protein
MANLKLIPEQFRVNDKFLRGPIYDKNGLMGYEEEWEIIKIEDNKLFFENDIVWKINDLSLTSLYNIKRN